MRIPDKILNGFLYSDFVLCTTLKFKINEDENLRFLIVQSLAAFLYPVCVSLNLERKCEVKVRRNYFNI